MSIRQKFYLAFGVIALLSVCLAIYGAVSLLATNDLVRRLYDQPLMGASYARAASAALNEARGSMDRGLLLGPGMANEEVAALRRARNDIAADLRIVRERVPDPAIVRAANRVAASITDWLARGEVILAPTGDGANAIPLPASVSQAGVKLAADLDELAELVSANGYGYRVRAAAGIHLAAITVIGLCAGIICSSALFALLFAHLLLQPIRAAIRIAEGVANGNETPMATTTRRDEIGTLLACLAAMQASLRSRAEERDRAAQTLRRINYLFEMALNNMSHGLVMSDADGQVVVVNQRFHDMFGLDRQAAIAGKSHCDVLAIGLAAGTDTGRSLACDMAEHTRILQSHRGGTAACVIAGGRTIAISYEPTPDGGCIATHEDVTERRKSEERIVFLARHDALTRLPNRVLFQERLEQALVQAERGEGFAFLYLDLDHFKEVNDTLGHPVGDELLCEVSARLRDVVRDGDTVARLGGDEFAILQLCVSSPNDVTALARRIIRIISEPYQITGHHVVIGTSIGVALAPVDGRHPAQLLKHADLALYRAKREGRGTCHFFEPTMNVVAKARRALELDLRNDALLQQLELHYQPVVSSSTRLVTGFEALLRWRHPARGLVPPNEFISIAEEIGMIVPIGEWVLRQACADAVGWPDDLGVAVNLSPVQLRAGGLIGTVESALQESGLAPGRLGLEITESVLMEENQATRRVLHDLRERGMRIALDDFGTGYSSLSYLQRFPFDTIKIDRAFVTKIETRAECLAIVRAVTGLGRSLNMNTIGEGVESEAQFEILAREGCDEIQGYLFSPPVPLAAVPALIARLSCPRTIAAA